MNIYFEIMIINNYNCKSSVSNNQIKIMYVYHLLVIQLVQLVVISVVQFLVQLAQFMINELLKYN